jgi:Cft2 family RNA processing exonuclease
MRLDKQVAILAILNLSVIGFPVFVEGPHGQAQEVLLDVDHLGSEFTHFSTVPFFCLGFSFNAN